MQRDLLLKQVPPPMRPTHLLQPSRQPEPDPAHAPACTAAPLWERVLPAMRPAQPTHLSRPSSQPGPDPTQAPACTAPPCGSGFYPRWGQPSQPISHKLIPTSNTMLRPRLARRKSGASGWANNTRANVGPTNDSDRHPWRRNSVGGGKWLFRSRISRLRLAKAMMSSSPRSSPRSR